MRLLFVHEVNYEQKVVYEIHDIPELLTLRGHDVTFIDFPEGVSRTGWRRLVDFRTRRRPEVSRAHVGSAVDVVTPGGLFPAPFDRLVASVTQVPAIRRELRAGGYDAIFLYAVPTNGWQTVLLAGRYRVPVLFRAIDISHELRPTVYRPLIKLAERFVYRHAQLISTNNVALASYVVEEGACASAVSVDYPGLDLTRFAPAERNRSLADRFGLAPEDRVVAFMGTFFRFSGLDWFLEEFAPVLAARPELKVLLIGGGEIEPQLRSRTRELGLESQVIFTGMVSYDELPDHLRLADVAINPFREELVTRCALPGKILQYAGCGLPTVCTRLDGMQGMISDGMGVLYREPGRPFVAAVLELVDSEHDRRAAGALARRAVEDLCDWTASTDRFEALLESLTSSGVRPTKAPRRLRPSIAWLRLRSATHD